MQNLPVYLYQNILDVTLDLDPTIRGVNRVMYQRDLKVQKGLKNSIRVQFKNSDQKNISINSTDTFVFSMFDAINRREILNKNLEVLDAGTTSTRGLALLTLTESDTLDLDRTSYTFSIKKNENNGEYSPAYSNTYYGINGTLHLLNDISPVLQDSKTVNSYTKLYNDDTQLYEHYSNFLYANPEYNDNTALHTIAWYMTAFRGTVVVQVTLDNSPSIHSNWATIHTATYDQYSGIDYHNFTGVYSFVRFKFIPAKAPAEPDNDNPAYYGSIDKVLYRS